jgi:hypothetical protein
LSSEADANMCSYEAPDPQEFQSVICLMDAGRGDTEIERLTGIPRGTISAWRHGRGSGWHRRLATARADWWPRKPAVYCYLLGVYLGDGSINLRPSGSASLIVTLDSAYPMITPEVASAMREVMGLAAVSTSLREGGSCTALQANHPALPFALPQHGVGRKHLRPIRLERWQRDLTSQHPEALVRGTSPLRRVPNRQPVQNAPPHRPSRGVRVPALLLLEPLRRHPADFLRSLRAARHQVDPVELAQHLGLGPKKRGAAFVGPKR